MKKIIIFALMLVVPLVTFVPQSEAIRLTLKRVVFEGQKRAEVITIINNGDKAETYRLSWRHFRMNEDKNLVPVSNDALPADIKPVVDMVRFAPRRFTIPPNSSQQVRMMLRMPANIPDGEYRSHLSVTPEADVEELRRDAERENAAAGKKGGVKLTMLAGVTMPVIVRKGQLSAEVVIDSLQVSARQNAVNVKFSILRSGDKSIYGDIDYICNPGSLGEYVLRTTRGIAVYTETSRRNFDLNLQKTEGQGACNDLSVTFTATDGFDGDKVKALAQSIAPVR